MIITIDGPAGVGKTTLARRMAGRIGIAYLDSGAMFRAVGWMAGEKNCGHDEKLIKEMLGELNFGLTGSGAESLVLLNSRRLGPEIRTEEAGMLASNIGRMESVRSFLKQAQQKIGSTTPLVAEGRDMGSVVFPEAPFKFFLDASPEVRAGRRHLQLERMGVQADYKTILEQIIKRDDQDRNRAIAPLKPAPEAIIIDTGALGPHEVFERMMSSLDKGL